MADETGIQIKALRQAAFIARSNVQDCSREAAKHRARELENDEAAAEAKANATALENLIIALGGEIRSYGLGEYDSPLTAQPEEATA